MHAVCHVPSSSGPIGIRCTCDYTGSHLTHSRFSGHQLIDEILALLKIRISVPIAVSVV